MKNRGTVHSFPALPVACPLLQRLLDAPYIRQINTPPTSLQGIDYSLPPGWAGTGNESEVLFRDEKGRIKGGVSLVGYYGDINSSLPNHSMILWEDDIYTALGKGSLAVLERSCPAASGSSKTWKEVHSIIPMAGRDMAYDFWIMGEDKSTLLKILKSINR